MPDVAALYIFGSEEYVGGVRTGRAGQGTHAWRCAGYWALFGMWGHLFSFLRDVDPFFCFFFVAVPRCRRWLRGLRYGLCPATIEGVLDNFYCILLHRANVACVPVVCGDPASRPVQTAMNLFDFPSPIVWRSSASCAPPFPFYSPKRSCRRWLCPLSVLTPAPVTMAPPAVSSLVRAHTRTPEITLDEWIDACNFVTCFLSDWSRGDGPRAAFGDYFRERDSARARRFACSGAAARRLGISVSAMVCMRLHTRAYLQRERDRRAVWFVATCFFLPPPISH